MRNNNITKTVLIAACLILSCASVTNAKAKHKYKDGGKKPAFHKGSKTLGFSLGFGVDYDYYGSTVALPVFALHYDQGIIDNVGPGTIGVGGIVGVRTAHYNYYGGYKATWTDYIVGVRGTYHLTLLKDKNNKFDPYGGVMLGLRFEDFHDNDFGNDSRSHSAYPVVGAFVGAKYNFSPHFGAFAELGYDISLFRIGICANF